MRQADVVRAWKDSGYRAALRSEDLARLPFHPSGLTDLSDEQLKEASGLTGIVVTTFRTCTEFTFRRFQCCR